MVDGEELQPTEEPSSPPRPDWEETLGPELDRCVEAVRRYCRTRTTSEVDAEDAAQDAFVRFLERAGQDTRNPEAWLIQAASFECRDLHRRRKRDIVAEPDEASTAVAVGGIDPERFVTQRLLVQALFKHLPARDRQLLALRYLADLSVEQLAARLSVSEGNARIMALRARRRAHDVLKLMEAGAAGVIGLVGAGSGRMRSALRRLWLRAQRRGTAVSQSIGNVDLAGAASGVQLAVPLMLAAVIAPLAAGGAAKASRVELASSPEAAAITPARNLVPVGSAPGGASSSVSVSEAPTGAHVDRPVTPAQVVAGVLPEQGAARQQDAVFNSMTPSPAYQQDGTVFASGTVVNGCTTACSALFVTHDRGASWSQVGTGMSTGGVVVLPARYPSDPALFLVTPLGLERSTDGGGSFELIVPGVTSAASVPNSSEVVLGNNPLTTYDPDQRGLQVGPALPPGMASLSSLTVLADGIHVVGAGTVPDPMVAGQQDGALVLCDAATCTLTARYPGELGLHVVVSPTQAADHSVVAFSDRALHVSTDDGQSFATVPGLSHIVSAALDPNFAHTGAITAGTVAPDGSRNTSRLYSSVDSGRSFQQISASGLPAELQLANVLALPDGRMILALTAPNATGEFGLRCSVDHGMTWKESC